MKNAQLRPRGWPPRDDYLKKYPHGEYSNEIRFRLGEHLQQQKDYVNAAKIYKDRERRRIWVCREVQRRRMRIHRVGCRQQQGQ